MFSARQNIKKPAGRTYPWEIGNRLNIEEGYKAARFCGISQPSTLKAQLGDLINVSGIVKLTGFVNSVPDFTNPSKVNNGFSDLMVKFFGERGNHARTAVELASLPLETGCMIEMIVAVIK